MVILVSDTSVLVDLERGGLLEAAFACGLPMAVPDLLYERELAEHNGRYLQSLGLAVVSLTPAEVALAQSLHTHRRALSLADCFALSCATRQGHTLVTGDRMLRAEAEGRQLTVVGLLGLLDRMAGAGMDRQVLHEGLTGISNDRRCRLPQGEVRSRLAQLQGPLLSRS